MEDWTAELSIIASTAIIYLPIALSNLYVTHYRLVEWKMDPPTQIQKDGQNGWYRADVDSAS